MKSGVACELERGGEEGETFVGIINSINSSQTTGGMMNWLIQRSAFLCFVE
jgi:hypothetical protein